MNIQLLSQHDFIKISKWENQLGYVEEAILSFKDNKYVYWVRTNQGNIYCFDNNDIKELGIYREV